MVRTRLGKVVLLDEREAHSATDKKNNNPGSLNNHMLQSSFRNKTLQPHPEKGTADSQKNRS